VKNRAALGSEVHLAYQHWDTLVKPYQHDKATVPTSKNTWGDFASPQVLSNCRPYRDYQESLAMETALSMLLAPPNCSPVSSTFLRGRTASLTPASA
jgi:hypothetical protein